MEVIWEKWTACVGSLWPIRAVKNAREDKKCKKKGPEARKVASERV